MPDSITTYPERTPESHWRLTGRLREKIEEDQVTLQVVAEDERETLARVSSDAATANAGAVADVAVANDANEDAVTLLRSASTPQSVIER